MREFRQQQADQEQEDATVQRICGDQDSRWLNTEDDSELDNEAMYGKSKNTAKSTRSHVSTLQLWAKHRDKDKRPITEWTLDELYEKLPRFILEVRKQDNTPYHKNAYGLMVSSIQRHLNEHRQDVFNKNLGRGVPATKLPPVVLLRDAANHALDRLRSAMTIAQRRCVIGCASSIYLSILLCVLYQAQPTTSWSCFAVMSLLPLTVLFVTLLHVTLLSCDLASCGMLFFVAPFILSWCVLLFCRSVVAGNGHVEHKESITDSDMLLIQSFLDAVPLVSVAWQMRLLVALGGACALRGQEEMYAMSRGMFTPTAVSTGAIPVSTVITIVEYCRYH
jgi:hypothetical protein